MYLYYRLDCICNNRATPKGVYTGYHVIITTVTSILYICSLHGISHFSLHDCLYIAYLLRLKTFLLSWVFFNFIVFIPSVLINLIYTKMLNALFFLFY